MQALLLNLLITKIALPTLKVGANYAIKKLSKMKNGLTKEVALGLLSPIVESVDNPIDAQDVIQIVEKLKG